MSEGRTGSELRDVWYKNLWLTKEMLPDKVGSKINKYVNNK